MNVNLIRDILLQLEPVASGATADSLQLTEHDPAVVSEHLQLLAQAGLVDVSGTDSGHADSGAHKLTVKGREFLRLAKNDVLWKRVLGELRSAGSTPTLQALNARMLEWSFMS